MGRTLIHPRDLEAWRRWHDSRHLVRASLRTIRARIRPSPAPAVDLWLPAGSADILVAVEATHASVAQAIVSPLAHLPTERAAVVGPPGWSPPVALSGHRRVSTDVESLSTSVPAPRVVLAAGHYTPIGAAVYAMAQSAGATFLVSQHGLLTPYSPPLPPEAHLLAWSEEDAGFWSNDRPDVRTSVVGSQLLHHVHPKEAQLTDTPVFLGQLHGAELPRRVLTRAASEFCRSQGAVYRPHPSERDRLSRAQHAVWERRGITIDRAPLPLDQTNAPVVSVFSTGVLEAAARGLPAWVFCPDPPAWLRDFWDRYGMRTYGEEPTAAPVRAEIEPAVRIAKTVLEAAA